MLFSILCPMPITACKEIQRPIRRLELIVQCGHSILAKRPVTENRGVLRNVYCTLLFCSCARFSCSVFFGSVSALSEVSTLSSHWSREPVLSRYTDHSVRELSSWLCISDSSPRYSSQLSLAARSCWRICSRPAAEVSGYSFSPCCMVRFSFSRPSSLLPCNSWTEKITWWSSVQGKSFGNSIGGFGGGLSFEGCLLVGLSLKGVYWWAFLWRVSIGGPFSEGCLLVGLSMKGVYWWVFLWRVSIGGPFSEGCLLVGLSLKGVYWWAFLWRVSIGGCFYEGCLLVGVSQKGVYWWAFYEGCLLVGVLWRVSIGGPFSEGCLLVGLSLKGVCWWMFLWRVSIGGHFYEGCLLVGVSLKGVCWWVFLWRVSIGGHVYEGCLLVGVSMKGVWWVCIGGNFSEACLLVGVSLRVYIGGCFSEGCLLLGVVMKTFLELFFLLWVVTMRKAAVYTIEFKLTFMSEKY